MPLALIVIIAVVVLVAIWFIAIYNGIVTADNKCENAWQTIDAQLQRRNDLIPNLVETVKGYAAHESGTLEAVTAARSAVASATTPEAKMEASNMLTNTLKSLFAVAEAYPNLKANTNFQAPDRPHRHGEQDQLRSHELQRRRARVQQRHQDVPRQHRGRQQVPASSGLSRYRGIRAPGTKRQVLARRSSVRTGPQPFWLGSFFGPWSGCACAGASRCGSTPLYRTDGLSEETVRTRTYRIEKVAHGQFSRTIRPCDTNARRDTLRDQPIPSPGRLCVVRPPFAPRHGGHAAQSAPPRCSQRLPPRCPRRESRPS